MRISLACFTDRGERLALRLAELLRAGGDAAAATRCGEGRKTLGEWTKEAFANSDALIFVGAAGIAVRAVAPHVASKTRDPAVAAVDDAGRFAIALLSGHIGGANDLALRVAGLIGATPVVTTATDAAGVFAADAWAAARGWAIANPERIKAVSARLLAGREVRFKSAFPVEGELPNGFVPASGGDCDLLIDIRNTPRPEALHIVPPVVSLGVGCRRGTAEASIAGMADAICRAADVSPAAIGKVCSIDAKKDEPGLLAFCRSRGLPLVTFGAEELAAVAGEFSSSAFVESTVGVDNVCERGAVAGSGGGSLLAKKLAGDGVAVALAGAPVIVDFP